MIVSRYHRGMGQPMPQQQPPRFPILITTMNDVPGFKVTAIFGEVFGLTVRSRNVFSNIGAGFRALGGGEITEYTRMLSDSRYEAMGRLCQAAMAYGANAVLAMRFDCNEIAGTMSEVAAYGTACVIVPDSAEAPTAQPPMSGAPTRGTTPPSSGLPAQS